MTEEKWIVFDLIGVLAEPSWRDIAKREVEDWDQFKQGHMAESDFWSMDERQLYRKLLRFRTDRLALVRRLKRDGFKVCVASNFLSEWLSALLEKSGEPNLFDEAILSADVRSAKPERAFFQAILKHAPPGSVFVDDQKPNCDAARDAGFTSIWAHPACQLEEEIDALLERKHTVAAAPTN